MQPHIVKIGFRGVRGEPGRGLNIKGTLADPAALPDGAAEGDGYLIDRDLWLWTGLAWSNAGPVQGPQGTSAYDVALAAGFVGSQADWVASIKGEPGDPGNAGRGIVSEDYDPETGVLQLTFSDGSVYQTDDLRGGQGDAGGDGDDGRGILSESYDAASGVLTLEFSDGSTFETGDLRGPEGGNGADAYQIAVAAGFTGTRAEWLASLNGEDGAPGTPGSPGADAYQVAVAAGFVGTRAEWLDSLNGEDGAPGAPGSPGTPGANATILAFENADTAAYGAAVTANASNPLVLVVRYAAT